MRRFSDRRWWLLMGLVWVSVACQKQAPPASEQTTPAAVATAANNAAVAAAPAASPASAPDDCAALCKRVGALGCKHEQGCVDNCRSMRTAPGCGAELQAVMACFGREPLTHWECNEEGEAAIKEGFCNAEQGKFVACVGKQGAH